MRRGFMSCQMNLVQGGKAMSENPATVVAFLFSSGGNNWHGGKNYYRSLFMALDADPKCSLRILAIVGRNTDCADFNFPASVAFVRSGSMDRLSLSWFFDRICKRLIRRTPLLARTLRKFGVQVVSHCDPHESAGLPCIAWIPDFQHVHLPQFFKSNELAGRNKQFKEALECADLIVVSSHDARKDLEIFSKDNAHKARVLQFCAVGLDLVADDGADVVKRYQLQERYFYLPNQFWAHKNHRLAVEALARVREIWPDAQIVCSGALSDYRNPAHIETLKARIVELGLQKNFKILGLIPYKHIAELMVQSAAVINPSLFEGWSTTVEEAKALGAPLLLSDMPVHREQCSSGEALFFAPDDSIALAKCMEQVLGGHWTQRSGYTLTTALKKHQERTVEFSHRYQAIVNELPVHRSLKENA